MLRDLWTDTLRVMHKETLVHEWQALHKVSSQPDLVNDDLEFASLRLFLAIIDVFA